MTQNKGHFAVQVHSRSRTDFGTNRKLLYDFLLVIIINLTPILHSFRHIASEKLHNRYIWLPLLRLTSPPQRKGSNPWDDLRKIFRGCRRMAKVPNGVENLPKNATG